jgi:WD40 repeat protein
MGIARNTPLLLAAIVFALGSAIQSPARAQDVYVVDSGASTVEAFSAKTGATASNFNSPQALSGEDMLAVSGNYLYTVDSGNDTIGKYVAATGAVVSDSLVDGNVTGDSLAGPIAVASGDIFVADNSNSIAAFNASTGAAVGTFNFGGTLDSIDYIAVANGKLYVASAVDDTIGVYSASTGDVINDTLLGSADGIEGITGMTISGTDLYVASLNDNTVNPYDIGEYNAGTGAAIDAALVSSTDVTADDFVAFAGGDLFVLDENTPEIDVYNGTTGGIVDDPLVSSTYLTAPTDLAIGAVPEPRPTLLLLSGCLIFLFPQTRRFAFAPVYNRKIANVAESTTACAQIATMRKRA